MTKFQKKVSIDFDATIHAHKTPWTRYDEIHDPPVPGAFDAIRSYLDADVEVHIHTCRLSTSEFNGVNADPILAMAAMASWFIYHGLESEYADRLNYAIHGKPYVDLYIDDRNFVFEGTFPTVAEIEGFRPWMKRGPFVPPKYNDEAADAKEELEACLNAAEGDSQFFIGKGWHAYHRVAELRVRYEELVEFKKALPRPLVIAWELGRILLGKG